MSKRTEQKEMKSDISAYVAELKQNGKVVVVADTYEAARADADAIIGEVENSYISIAVLVEEKYKITIKIKKEE